jgi:adenosylcobyric acid synthase
MTKAAVIMIQGTASSVGKSLITTALCRLYRKRGLKVAPFKAQNMALNSAVTWEGHEIGRAQAAQAEACGVRGSSLMNPVLLKPEGERRSQVIVRGKSWGSMQAAEYHQIKPQLRGLILESLEELRSQFDLVVIEGAGSPAEINLKDHDIVNMFVARSLEAPVLLVGDIDRGGVFAALVGTMELLTPEERRLVAGFVINKFRGDPALLGTGLDFLKQKTGVNTLGVIPFKRDHRLAEEDSLSLEEVPRRWKRRGGQPRIAIVQLPRISNFDEFSPLVRCPGLDVIFTSVPDDILGADLVILPGTKNTLEDLAWLRAQGLGKALEERLHKGLHKEKPDHWILAICGGCQMLGEELDDRAGVETEGRQAPGLGILPVKTVFKPLKRTVQAEIFPKESQKHLGDPHGEQGWSWLHDVLWGPLGGLGAKSQVDRRDGEKNAPIEVDLIEVDRKRPVRGYEIHAGQTSWTRGGREHDWGIFHLNTLSPTEVPREWDGVMSSCAQVVGTMVHGLFENPGLPMRLARWLRSSKGDQDLTQEVLQDQEHHHVGEYGEDVMKEKAYDELAEHLERHLNMVALDRIIFGKELPKQN